MKLLKIFLSFFIFSVLTVLTQVGGILFLISALLFRLIKIRFNSLIFNVILRFFFFLGIYCLATFFLVPKIAGLYGRVPLPISKKQHFQAHNFLTCFLNRNYVQPDLRDLMFEVATQLNQKFPGTEVHYLDANFPFLDNFPLVPHLSHDDGKKLDLSFFYLDAQAKLPSQESPSFLGYGICEGPRPNEKNTASFCRENGYWQYGILENFVPQGRKKDFVFDSLRTRELIQLIVSQPAISKVFLEPHLKTRLHLTSDKIRFHGCRAVRHDDHIHIQVQ